MTHDPARQRSVGIDMERIFGSDRPPSRARDLEDAPWASAQSPGLRKRPRVLLRPTMLAALALLVLAVGWPFVRGVVRDRAPAHQSRVATPTLPRGRDATVSTPAHVAKPVPEIGREVEKLAPVIVAKERPATVARRRKPERDSPPPLRRAAAPRSTPRRAAAARPLVHADQKHGSPSRAAAERVDPPCARGKAEDACIYQDVVAADRRLRDAYADAARNGAPSKELVAIRRSWQKARDISLKAPDETIRRFNGLTDRLTRLDRAAPR